MHPVAKILIGVVVGGALGYANYRLIGCRTGACPLTGNPWVSTLYGMVVGGMIGSAFK